MTDALRVADLCLTYGRDHPALVDVSLSVGAGELVALIGGNGAGKSTLLRSVIGLLRPSEGEVVVDGVDVRRARRAELRRVRTRTGMIAQSFCLARRLSAFDNVLHGALGRTGPRGWLSLTAPEAERAEAIGCLERVGLAGQAERRVDQLSGGQRQRVAIARVLMQRPRLILADEPVASLDPSGGIAVMEILRSLARDDGLAIVVALHQLDLAERYADRLVGLKEGRISFDLETASCDRRVLERLYVAEAAA